VLVDDSIVRGTTLKKITKMIREAGAKEIHLRISSPPHQWPCFYGIDFPTREELIAATRSREEIRKFLNVESLEYISLEGLLKAVRNVKAGFCLACFDGRYPVAFEQAPTKGALEAASTAKAAGRKG
jgi:amidophosphoribosyltransferase